MKSFAIGVFAAFILSYFLYFSKNLDYSAATKNPSGIFVPTMDSSLNAQFMRQGQLVSIRDVLGTTDTSIDIVIHFWATWCPPCIEELPQLYEFAQKSLRAKKRVKFIFVAVKDEQIKIDQFAKKFGINLDLIGTTFIDLSDEAYRVFRVSKLPETFIMRKNEISRLSGSQQWKEML